MFFKSDVNGLLLPFYFIFIYVYEVLGSNLNQFLPCPPNNHLFFLLTSCTLPVIFQKHQLSLFSLAVCAQVWASTAAWAASQGPNAESLNKTYSPSPQEQSPIANNYSDSGRTSYVFPSVIF